MWSKEEIYEKVEKAINKSTWISPLWEPYEKCEDKEKENFTLFINLIAQFYPRSLGAIEVKFEKCDPRRGFLCFDESLGHDPNFMDKYLKEEITYD